MNQLIKFLKNELGQKVGEVRGSRTGNVVVSNSWGIPVNTANVTKDSSGKKKALVNGGLFGADTEKQQNANCPGCKLSFLVEKSITVHFMHIKYILKRYRFQAASKSIDN